MFSIVSNATRAAEVLQQWQKNQTGPLVATGASHLIFLRLPDTSSIFTSLSDPSAGLNTPHIEMTIVVRCTSDFKWNIASYVGP